MSKRHERRLVRPGLIEVRADDGPPTITAQVLTYNTVDDYNTLFRPGVFADSLAERMPRIVWSHDWSDPIGRWTEVVADDDTRLVLRGELDDLDAVPQARRAWAQLRSGTIDQFSVGFYRLADETVDPDEVDGARGVMAITRGQLDEASLVLVGAVPNTKLLAVRSLRSFVSEDAVIDLAKKMAAGEITEAEAKAALKLVAEDNSDEGGGSEAPNVSESDVGHDTEGESDAPEVDAELDALIEGALDIVETNT